MTPILTLRDRCDRCNAQAYVLATRQGSSLTLCAHHGRQHDARLRAAGFTIQSDRVPA